MNWIGTNQRRGARTWCCTITVSALLSLGGVSCGQSGPLFLPAAEPAVTVEEPAASRDENETSGDLAENPAEAAGEEHPDRSDREHEKTP